MLEKMAADIVNNNFSSSSSVKRMPMTLKKISSSDQ